MDDDDSALLPVLLKGFRGQAFSRVRPLQVVKGDVQFFLPAGIENRRLQLGAARRVGIAFRGHIEAAFFAPSITAISSGVYLNPMLVMCTTWSGAPVEAAAAITSSKALKPVFGSFPPA